MIFHFYSIGEDWYKARSTMAKQILKPKAVGQYIPAMNDVTDSLVDRIRDIRPDSDSPIESLPNELCKWATESKFKLI